LPGVGCCSRIWCATSRSRLPESLGRSRVSSVLGWWTVGSGPAQKRSSWLGCAGDRICAVRMRYPAPDRGRPAGPRALPGQWLAVRQPQPARADHR
jgi:hypothetical protein